MKNSFRTALILPFVTIFMFLAVWTPVHAELPDCLKNLNSIEATSDPNIYTMRDVTYGKLQIYLSNNRFMFLEGARRGETATWACVNGKLTFSTVTATTTTPPSTTGGQAGGTIPPSTTGGQAGGTQVTSTQEDFPLMIKLKNPLKVNTIQEAIKLFMETVVKIAIPFIVVFFIWSGISFILARGNPTDITKAKNMFFYTVIGTLLILGAWAITDAIVGTINSFAS